MHKIEYTKRLEDICEELLTIDWGDDRNAYDSYLAEAITAIQQLNNEAIGKDERKSYAGHERLAAKQPNQLRQKLRAVIGDDK